MRQAGLFMIAGLRGCALMPPTERSHRACAPVAWHGPPLVQAVGDVPDAKPSTDLVTDGSQNASG